jgi:hypothetical protein
VNNILKNNVLSIAPGLKGIVSCRYMLGKEQIFLSAVAPDDLQHGDNGQTAP